MRTIRVEAACLSVDERIEKLRGLPQRLVSGASVELRGLSDEPVRDVSEYSISVHLNDREVDPEPPVGVGAVIRARPSIQAVVFLRAAQFDRAWALAASGRLRFCTLVFTAPQRNSARVLSASFDTEAEL